MDFGGEIFVEDGSVFSYKDNFKELQGYVNFDNKGFNPRYINQGSSYGQTGFQRRSGAVKAAEYGAVASVFRSLSSIEDDVPHTGSMSYKNAVDSIPHGGLGVSSAQKLSKEQSEYLGLKIEGPFKPEHYRY